MSNTYKVELLTKRLSLDEYITEYMNRVKVEGYCKQCDKYGNCWSCPPFDLDIDNYLKKYSKITIYAHKLIIGDSVICDNAAQETQRLFKSLREKSDRHIFAKEIDICNSVAFVAGSCSLCEKCEKPNPCKYPNQMRRSLESIGFDMARTAEVLFDTELKWGSENSLPQYMFLISALVR